MATYLGTRQLKDGSTRHRFIVRRKGAPRKVFTADTKTEAKKAARKYETEIDEGRVTAGKATVGHALDCYLKSDAFDSLSDADRREQMIEWWRGRIGTMSLSNLDALHDAIAEGRDALAVGEGPSGEPVSKSTRNRYMASLSKALKVARRERSVFRRLLRYNPALELGRASETGNERTRILSDDEFYALLAACRETGDRRLPTLFLCALSSAARKSELLRCRRAELNLSAGVCPVWRTKAGTPRNLRFHGMALDALREYVEEQLPNVSGALFPGRWGDPTFPRKAWDKALDTAGLKGEVVWHTLRHSSMTWAAILGATEAELMAHGGHKTSVMVSRYVHLAEHRTSDVAPLLIAPFARTRAGAEAAR